MTATFPKKLEGTVMSNSMDKTVVVEVRILKAHPKYKKFMKTSKRYKAHDEGNEYKVGQRVSIVEVRPISKDKKWKVKELLADVKGEMEDITIGEVNEDTVTA